MVKTKVVDVKSEPWNWVGIVEDGNVEETTPVVSEDECVDSAGKNEEIEGEFDYFNEFLYKDTIYAVDKIL